MTVTIVRKTRQYFLGGATWNGHEDQYDDFVLRGIWQSGWDPKDDDYAPIIAQIRPNDRIAIKKGLGGGNSDIVIRAIGIVKDVDNLTGTVYVNWIEKGMKRKVYSHGCFKTLHGPYVKGNDLETTNWINRTFCI